MPMAGCHKSRGKYIITGGERNRGRFESCNTTIIGHISSETTLNIYTHITDNMQRSAADKIERGFGRNEGTLGEDGQTPDRAPNARRSEI